MKPEKWSELSQEARQKYAIDLAESLRGTLLFHTALTQAAVIARGVEQYSDADDYSLLAEELFPMGEPELINVPLDQIENGQDELRDSKSFDAVASDNFTIRDEANAIVAFAFRNGPIEDLHAGKSSHLLDDPELSRISDGEMKALMISACEKMAELLILKQANHDEYRQILIDYGSRYCSTWNF